MIILKSRAGIRFAAVDLLGLLLCLLSIKAQPLRTPQPVPAPQINGPHLIGTRPGRPFLYRIPCTGQRPIQFEAKNLPVGLELDQKSGIIRGTAPEKRGEYVVRLQARNQRGHTRSIIKIRVGDTLALTPPMGWNSWYTWYNRITDQLMRQAADSMIRSGMADFGYQYVNIDDCWMIKNEEKNPMINGIPRNAAGAILPNKYFPEMKVLTDYIHAQGLKAGIYTSPGPYTCQVYTGSYQHEEADARQFASWGFDFLKYDWCSYAGVATGEGLERAQAPYRLMGAILQKVDRDIVFNLCQYGKEEVWKWGADVGGHCWRTTGDLGLEKGTQLPGFYHIGRKNAQHYLYSKPGAWNDPDYILIGYVGNAHDIDEPPQKTRLTPDEQYSYMSMWSLMAAPLFFSGDINRLDPFTLNVLCNAEVIEVNQDPLGKQGRPVRENDNEMALLKPLEDGSFALGLFNLSPADREITFAWNDLGLKKKQRIRDLWYQKELGTFSRSFSAKISPHGVTMVRLWAQ